MAFNTWDAVAIASHGMLTMDTSGDVPDSPTIALSENTAGTSLKFIVTDPKGSSMKIFYKLLGAAAWIQSSAENTPIIGTEFEITGLTAGKRYEFLPYAYSELSGAGEISLAGNYLQVFTTGGFGYEIINNIIRSRFGTQVEDIVSGLSGKVQYDNVGGIAFVKPVDNSLWVRLSILYANASGVSLGKKRYRASGIMMASIFNPLGKGDIAILQIADAIDQAFKSVSDSGVRFLTPTAPVTIGREEGEWQVNISCPFEADFTT